MCPGPVRGRLYRPAPRGPPTPGGDRRVSAVRVPVQRRRHGFLNGGSNRRQCGQPTPKYPKNRKKHRILATLFSNLGESTDPVFKSAGVRTPRPPVGDAPVPVHPGRSAQRAVTAPPGLPFCLWTGAGVYALRPPLRRPAWRGHVTAGGGSPAAEGRQN